MRLDIYRISWDSDYQSISNDDYQLAYLADIEDSTQSLKGKLKPSSIELYERAQFGRKKKLKKGNDIFGYYPSLPYLILSEKAINNLKDLLEPNGEILKLENTFDEKEYYIFNCLNRVDAFYNKSDDDISARDNLFNINQAYPIEKNLKEEVIFKDKSILLYTNTPTYVTRVFVNRVLETKLKGFRFYHIWSNIDERQGFIDT